ncbi:MAG: EamA family transporter [Ruminococcaceae bacterium]|nr:EamA family transporter [Oscillospiraceae bacterium]
MKKDTLGIVYVLIAGILWGTMGIFVNYFDSINLGSIDISGIRMFFASVLVILFILIKNPSLLKIKIKDIWCFLGSGLLSLMIFTICYFRTIVLSSMSVAAVLLYTSPVFVIVLSLIIFKEKITKIKALSCIVCVAGTAFVSGVIGSDTKISIIAFLLGVTSGFAYALYSIFSRFALQKGYPSITITAYTFLFATSGLIFFADIEAITNSVLTKPSNCVIMLLSGLITAVLPYLFYTMGLEKIESGKAAVVAAVEPVVAVILGKIIFDDPLSGIQYFGIILVIMSIAIQNIKIKRR